MKDGAFASSTVSFFKKNNLVMNGQDMHVCDHDWAPDDHRRVETAVDLKIEGHIFS